MKIKEKCKTQLLSSVKKCNYENLQPPAMKALLHPLWSIHLKSSASLLTPAGSLLRIQGVWAVRVSELASWSVVQHFFMLWCHSLVCSEQPQAAWGPRPCLRTPNASVIKIPWIIYSEPHPAESKCAEVARWKEGKKPRDLQLSVHPSKMSHFSGLPLWFITH